MCPVEREHDRSGCRVSGLTPELPVHVVLVPPLLVPPLLVPSLLVPPLLVPSLLVPPLLRFQALVPTLLRLQSLEPMLQRQPHRVCYFLDCNRKFRLRLQWWLKNNSRLYYVGHRIVQSTLLLSFFAAPEAYKRGRLFDGYITMETRHILIAADTTENDIEECSTQSSGMEPQVVLYVSVSALRVFGITRFGILTN